MLNWVPYTRKRQHSNLQSEVNSASLQSEWVIFADTARWFIVWLVKGVLTSTRFPWIAWRPPALTIEIPYSPGIIASTGPWTEERWSVSPASFCPRWYLLRFRVNGGPNGTQPISPSKTTGTIIHKWCAKPTVFPNHEWCEECHEMNE